MDLRQGTIGATVAEREAVDSILGPAVSRWEGGERSYEFEGHIAHGGHEARERRHLLLPILLAMQARVGWISEGALEHISERLTVPHADVYGVATFYGLLSVEPRAPRGEGADWDPPARVPQEGDSSLRLLQRVGRVQPNSLDDYRANGGYAALRRAIELGPEGVSREVKDSGLVGRGGAAFPPGVKGGPGAGQPVRPHYLVCNADESEPGTFKDRALMEGDPYSLIEAMTIAGYATGCERGYIYLRGEYPQAHAILSAAIAEARSRGFLGSDVLGHGFAFEVEIRRGAGAYICGEETSIFNSIEGYRGEPRSKPPFPVVSGLFEKPTVVNNVETLVNVLPIVLEGGPAFAQVGGGGMSTGPRLFCLSGCVERPGVYELPHGVTLGELIELAGGVAGGRRAPAVLLGGAPRAFVGPARGGK